MTAALVLVAWVLGGIVVAIVVALVLPATRGNSLPSALNTTVLKAGPKVFSGTWIDTVHR